MKLALGKMQMDPDVFWGMSMKEFFAATDGFSEFHSSGSPPPISREEVEDLMERYPD